MPTIEQLANAPRCQHIHYDGRPCKAPARRGRNYCMFHQSAHSDSGHLALPIIEDTHSLQLAIIRILHSLADDSIDGKKASAMLYGLQLAGMNMKLFSQERLRIEDPEGDIARRAYATFISKKMKMPVPTQNEIDQLLAQAEYKMPAEPPDRPPVIFPASESAGAQRSETPVPDSASASADARFTGSHGGI